MHALDLIALLPDQTAEDADAWVRAALAEANALRRHDGRLVALTGDPAATATAAALRTAWHHWADDADALLRRLPAPPGPGETPERRDLRACLRHARALAAVRAGEMGRRYQKVADGTQQTLTVEEARRELGLASRR